MFCFVFFFKEAIKIFTEHHGSILQLKKEKLKKVYNHVGETLAHVCCQRNHFKILQWLIKKSNSLASSSSSKGKKKGTKQQQQQQQQQQQKIYLARDADGDTPLHAALRCGSFECVQLLVEEDNVNLLIVNKSGLTPLHLALEMMRVRETRMVCLKKCFASRFTSRFASLCLPFFLLFCLHFFFPFFFFFLAAEYI